MKNSASEADLRNQKLLNEPLTVPSQSEPHKYNVLFVNELATFRRSPRFPLWSAFRIKDCTVVGPPSSKSETLTRSIVITVIISGVRLEKMQFSGYSS